VDATGLYALDVFASRCRKKGTVLVLSGVQEQPRRVMEKMGFDKVVGPENICRHIDEALGRAQEILAARRSSGVKSRG
jgi:SulP family sulfate permease